jgi:hypothetical protein
MAFKGSEHLTAKIIIDNKVTEQINEFNYLGYNVSYISNNDFHN